jgi:hypothetical protein
MPTAESGARSGRHAPSHAARIDAHADVESSGGVDAGAAVARDYALGEHAHRALEESSQQSKVLSIT